jgi:cytidine deaminase
MAWFDTYVPIDGSQPWRPETDPQQPIDGQECSVDRDALCAAALRAAENAYAPYSKFRVGAAVLGRDIHVGANIENASYGASLCAERAALSAALVAGETTIRAIAIGFLDVAADAGLESMVPCGICRQWLAEIAPGAEVIICGSMQSFRVDELLPYSFRLKTRPDST